jgi:chloramphenicol 3-O phosphotransferase
MNGENWSYDVKFWNTDVRENRPTPYRVRWVVAGRVFSDSFLGGAASQQRWKRGLDALQVLWAGVRCQSAVAAGREIARGDRVIGMAASQAEVVHQGVVYDLQVDTAHTEALECARAIAARVR